MKTSLSSTFRTFDKVDNQTFGDTLQKLNQLLMGESQSGSNWIAKSWMVNYNGHAVIHSRVIERVFHRMPFL